MVITIFFLIFIFLLGFLNLYFYLPSKKLSSWVKSFFTKTSSTTSIAKTITTSTSLEDSCKENITTSCACSNYSTKDVELKSVFSTFDKNGDGFITKQEMRESLKNIRIFMTEKEVEDMVRKVDSNDDGLIDFEEFSVLCESILVDGNTQECLGDEKMERKEGENDLKDAFDVFDKDKDGLISVEELGSVLCSLGLKEGKRMEDCKEMIRKVDVDGDGMVNFDEFKMMMKGGGGKLLCVF